MAPGQNRPAERAPPEPSARRFREIHHHRFPLGVRSNIHGTCLLRSHLPVRIPRPHTMQTIHTHPPPGVGYRRFMPPQSPDARGPTVQPHQPWQEVVREINDERRRVASWLDNHRAIARTHVVVATQSGLQFFVAGFGFWSVLDVDLGLRNEACVGIKAFEVSSAPSQNADAAAATAAEQGEGEGQGYAASIEQHRLPLLITALTTYVKQPSEARRGTADESGTYRLYAFGHASLPPLPQAFVDRHALGSPKKPTPASPAESPDAPSPGTSTAPSSSEDSAHGMTLHGQPTTDDVAATTAAAAAANLIQPLPVNSYAYLEERLFALHASNDTLCLELDYLPFRISQDVADGMPPILLVAGNDNKVHRYALGGDRIVEVEPLLSPKTQIPLTFTVFDARVIGPYHVQVTAHQEFAVALQASHALTAAEADAASRDGAVTGDPAQMRRLLVADQEIYDAAPVLATVFTPDAAWIDRTAFDYVVTHRAGGGSGAPLAANDIYQAEWPIGAMGTFPRPDGSASTAAGDAGSAEQLPRVHALIGFVGEDAVVYHDVPVAGLDPVPTLVGGVAGQVPASAPHVARRLGGLGGVFSLPGSSQEGLLTSVHFDDLDFDGTKEIIAGTVAGAVLVYKYVPARGYVIVWKRRFPAPVYGIFSADINSDGANELVVVTLLGVHILQPNLAHVRAKLLRRLVLVAEASSDGASDKTQDQVAQ
ncbi:hypothetical protein LPJ61_000448 [Coemansia biformis]|uniref:FG-GAP repeat protein n=1 Tax=Coemansia biformis TaxID=1286918 RepID=A0A9W7YBQ2_9FUNG|nr:hypothetical protein LPJ61_000448 [Coemansia biformis]